MGTSSPRTVVSEMASQGIMLGIGLVSFVTAWCFATLENQTLWPKDTRKQREDLNSAQEKFWSLDREPLGGFRHAFFVTRRDVKLHYIVKDVEGGKGSSIPLVVFIHGFPDSCFLWRKLLQSPNLNNYMLVAVDLPGYGGSDSLPAYNAFNVLEALTEFLQEMRRDHASNGDKMVVVTHDWGSVIGARLTSEAKTLADHWIITSGIIPQLTLSNAQHQAALSKRLLSSWTRSPLRVDLVKEARSVYAPVLAQFRRSFYIFCFLLPCPLATTFSTFGNYWFLRACHRYGIGPALTDADVPTDPQAREEAEAEAMAISTGPGPAQIKHTDGQSGYGSTVRTRTQDRGMSEKLRLYRESLFTGKWEKSNETIAALEAPSYTHDHDSSATVTHNTAPKGALQAPATIVYGENDPAFVQSLALDNARDYLVKGSQVFVVEGGGHWLPIEKTGCRVLEEIIMWAVGEREMERDGGEVVPEVEGLRLVEAV